MATYNKRKIFNDAIYGFVTVKHDLLFDLIEHPYFQRLRRITQLGLTNLVYGGANHTRFQHVMGAMHLMSEAIDVLRLKGVEISDEEALGASIAILLHDVGHGPYSHTLEFALLDEIHHEVVSACVMEDLNKQFDGRLDMAIEIFRGTYPKQFLHQLVSSQLDMDRMDYLRRDSFFTGVSEGVIGSERLIKLLNVSDDQLCVEQKGIYSVEKFLIARRIMYWQVYLHKTVLAAEHLMMKILKRAKELAAEGVELFCSPPLHAFLYNSVSRHEFETNPKWLPLYMQLDDYDVVGAIKAWQFSDDKLLARLSSMLLNRRLYRIEIQDRPFDQSRIEDMQRLLEEEGWENQDLDYLVFSDKIENRAYSQSMDKIFILHKDGSKVDIATDADLMNIHVLSEPVTKYFLCYPKNL